MASTILTPPKPKAPPESTGGGGNGLGLEGFPRHWGSPEWSVPPRAYRTGMWMGLAGITMVFAAFTSALVVRKGMGSDWAPTTLPPILYLNTVVLLASSLTLELSRRSFGRSEQAEGSEGRFLGWWYATLVLGGAFIAGQLVAWRQLSALGVYLSTNPSSSFFYLLTAAHGLHLLGGIAALAYVALRARGGRFVIGKRTAVDLTALYWHFMDGLWIYLLFLLVTRL